MNKFLKRFFVVIAALCALSAALRASLAFYIGESLLPNRIFWASIFGVVFFLLAAFKFGTPWKFRIFMVIFMVVLLEVVLEATAWLGLLPGIDCKITCPYGRVYWTSEGLGNSIRNRNGWYYPEFDLKATNRVLSIGDSFVEAVDVHRTRNFSYLLHQRLKQDSPEWSVLGMGMHGACPAFYMDLLDYAWKYYTPSEAIIFISIGSDVSDSSPEVGGVSPSEYMYYDVNAKNELVLNPASANFRARLEHYRELGQKPVLFSITTILSSHCMILQSLSSARDGMVRRHRLAEMQARAGGASSTNDLGQLGFIPAPFAVQPTVATRHAMAILQRELEACKQICDSHNMKLRLVAIPTFPKPFYDTQKGRDWTMHIGDYDYFGPCRELAAFADAHNIPYLDLGEYIQSKRMSVDEIRSLYFINGMGHFTEKGHRFCADAVYEAFYKPKQK